MGNLGGGFQTSNPRDNAAMPGPLLALLWQRLFCLIAARFYRRSHSRPRLVRGQDSCALPRQAMLPPAAGQQGRCPQEVPLRL